MDTKRQIRQANESKILAAAERIFAGAGFSGATMAQIAEESGLPKANLHYYFGNKEALYRAVLAHILQDWLAPTHGIVLEADPREAIESYIRSKMALSASRPHASKVWANELLHGATVIGELLATELRPIVKAKAAVIDQWTRRKESRSPVSRPRSCRNSLRRRGRVQQANTFRREPQIGRAHV